MYRALLTFSDAYAAEVFEIA